MLIMPLNSCNYWISLFAIILLGLVNLFIKILAGNWVYGNANNVI